MRLEDGYVPAALFSKDHWSTLAYAETCMVDQGGFQVGFDGRMRQGRAHFRVMSRDCPRPQQSKKCGPRMGVVMQPEHSTRLKGGAVVAGHDDWHCIQDMVNAGYLGIKRGDGLVLPLPDEIDAGVRLHLTPLGQRVVGQLRAWKALGGHYADFAPKLEEQHADA